MTGAAEFDSGNGLVGRGRRVLLVEDNAVVALELVMILQDAGFEPVGPASSRPEARALIARESFDAAVLDIHLGAGAERDGAALADLLCDLGVPFVFVSGHPREALDPALRTFAHLPKPVAPAALIRQLVAHLDEG